MSEKDVIVGDRGLAVARNVSALRKRLGIGYAELSRRVGGQLADLAIRRIEAGHRRVDVDDLFRLADALEVSVPRLLSANLSYALTGIFEAPAGESIDGLLDRDEWADEFEDLRRFRDRIQRVVDEERERTDG